MQTITSFLWFDNQAEEAANFYVSVFKNSKVKQITHYTGEDFSGKKGQVMTVSFELNGQEFTALNGGPQFKFTEAVSFVINCETRRRSIITGRNSLLAAGRKWNADGSRTSTDSFGK
jgi:predicted 3-demethylubiquinone-9 3-methyltransferase (glyoxalase superfamily)